MFKTVLLVAATILSLSTACNSSTQPINSKPDTTPPELPQAIITKLELAQTHLIPPEGKSWSGSKLAKYNLHLVGNREALVLVDFAATSVQNPVLEAFVAGQKLGEVALNAPVSLPATEANGTAYSSMAFWAKLEKAWIKPGLSLRLKGSNTNPSEAQAVTVGAPAEFTSFTLPFYLFGLTETAVSFAQATTVNQASKDEYFAKHPFAALNIINHPVTKVVWPYIIIRPRDGRAAQKVEYQEQQPDKFAIMSAVLDTLGAIRDANGDEPLNNHYYAPLLMANQAGQYVASDGGLGGGDLGTGDYAYSGIYIHEAGHAFGMPHADDGYNSFLDTDPLNSNQISTETPFPYVGGSLKGSSWGFDQIKNRFLSPLVPSTAKTFKNCKTGDFPRGRQLDDQGRCIKQDPMQSGSGDQDPLDRYTMFADFNAGLVQQYLEGTTSLKNGEHAYDGGRVFVNANSPTGYSRWDGIDSSFVPASTQTLKNGLFGFNNGLPIQRDVPVQTIIMSANVASTDPITNSPNTYTSSTTQIYPPLSQTGNLRRLIDAKDATQLASIVPDQGEFKWYCKDSGCDYTLKITFKDDSQKYVVLQRAFRKWFSAEFNPEAGIVTNPSSYQLWGVNILETKAIAKLELLETVDVWKGLPAVEKVIASRTVN